MEKQFKTHRCEGSLQAEVSIRNSSGHWVLKETLFDYDWGTHFQSTVCQISYCPFCGLKLEKEGEDNC